MIIKQVPMRSLRKSSFSDLVGYISDERERAHRVGGVRISNCASGRVDAAIEEILATQALNRRARSDKTCHLIVSFRAGETPSPEVLQQIEERVCAGLGYSEHQRISALHTDTDNWHVHIAINKIHPERRTIHEPYYSHRTMGQLCETLEREFNLEVDNHCSRQTRSAGQADDVEAQSGIESLTGWIRRNCLEEIQSAETWTILHEVLTSNGLSLHVRANGLIFSALNGTSVKASSVDRALSKSRLEARLGAFQPGGAFGAGEGETTRSTAGTTDGCSDEITGVTGECERVRDASNQITDEDPVGIFRQYERRPLPLKVNTDALYASYVEEQRLIRLSRSERFSESRALVGRQIAEARRAYLMRRSIIRLLDGRGFSKRLLYAQARAAYRKRVAAAIALNTKARLSVPKTYKVLTWLDWLKKEATQGNLGALEALRAREGKKMASANSVSGSAHPRFNPLSDIDTVTKKGAVIYRSVKTPIRDDGSTLHLASRISRTACADLLRLSLRRFLGAIEVHGSAPFKAAMVWVAAKERISVLFSDPSLERRRVALANSFSTQTKDNPHESLSRDNAGQRFSQTNDRGRSDRPRAGAHRQPGTTGNRFGQHRSGRVTTGARKPHITGAGQGAATSTVNRLRTLSQLDVVRISSGSEVLMPRDVPDRVEQHRAESDLRVRRADDVRKVGSALDAVDRYVAERTQKRSQIADIPKHERYTPGHDAVSFAGTRVVEGHRLLLLKRADTVLVLPLAVGDEKRLSRLSIGSVVRVDQNGSLHISQSRSR